MAQPSGFGGRDYPDFGVSNNPNRTGYVKDLAELAVRLGSPNYFDRLGVQLYAETFEFGIRDWYTSIGGAGSSINLIADYASDGVYAVRLTSGDAAGRNARISRYLPYPYLSTVGIEYHVKVLELGANFYASLWMYDGTTAYILTLTLDPVGETLTFNTESFGNQSIDISPFANTINAPFHIIKARADIVNGQWVEITVDTDGYDASAYDVNYVASGADKQSWLYFDAQTSVAGNGLSVALDSVIVTIDEPL